MSKLESKAQISITNPVVLFKDLEPGDFFID